MKFSQLLKNQIIEFECDSYSVLESGLIIRGRTVTLNVSFPIIEYYQHGWQSWSLTAWIDPKKKLGRSFPKPLQVLQTDIQYTDLEFPNGSWLGAVSNSQEEILLLGSLELESHVELKDNSLIGRNEVKAVEWFISFGHEDDTFLKYASIIGEKYGCEQNLDSPKVWCSWYSFYEEVNEEYLMQVTEDLAEYAVDIVQVDDGWQKKVGEWEANSKFPSGMKSLATYIRRSGKKAGLWLAPLLVVPSSKLFIEHQDWLLRNQEGSPVSAGFNWSEELYALDTTHPQVLEWLSNLMTRVLRWGFDYIKLDFLYAGALPGVRYKEIPREEAFRLGLKTMRDALGGAYLLTCGTPILPSLGLCDAIRIGPDVSGTWMPYLENKLLNNYAVPGVQNAIRTSLNRLWLKSIIQTDPDVVYFRSQGLSLTTDQMKLLRSLALITDFKATSDIPHVLSTDERNSVATFLDNDPVIQKLHRYSFQIAGDKVDFSSSINLLPELTRTESFLHFVVRLISNNQFALRLFTKINSRLHKRAVKNLFQKK